MMRNATWRTFLQLIYAFSIGICILLSCPSSSLASADVCQQPSNYSHLSVAYYNHDESALSGSIGRINQENHDFDLQYKRNEKWLFGVGHRYVILDFDPIELQTNGHLHTLFFPLHRQSGSDSKNFRFSIAPALSASSNVMKDPGEYSEDAFQLLAALEWSRKLSERTTLRYGVCGDNRFGSYKIYPSISVDWRPHTDLIFELGFPTTRLTYQPLAHFSSSLRIAPSGNEWLVKSKDMERQSQLLFEATLLEWTVNWEAHEQFTVSASIGRLIHSRYDVTLVDDSRARLSSDSVTRIGAALEWRF